MKLDSFRKNVIGSNSTRLSLTNYNALLLGQYKSCSLLERNNVSLRDILNEAIININTLDPHQNINKVYSQEKSLVSPPECKQVKVNGMRAVPTHLYKISRPRMTFVKFIIDLAPYHVNFSA